jgi:hypothetical protein
MISRLMTACKTPAGLFLALVLAGCGSSSYASYGQDAPPQEPASEGQSERELPEPPLLQRPLGDIQPIRLAAGKSSSGSWRLEASSGRYEPDQLCVELVFVAFGAGALCGLPNEMPAVTIGGAQATVDSDTHFIFGVSQDPASTIEVRTDQRVVRQETIGDQSFDGVTFFVVELPADEIVADFTALRGDNSTFRDVSSEALPYGSAEWSNAASGAR